MCQTAKQVRDVSVQCRNINMTKFVDVDVQSNFDVKCRH